MPNTADTINAALQGRDRDARIYSTRHGPMFGLKGDQYVTRSLELYGEFSWFEWRLFEQLVSPGQTVVEIGANIGAHTVPLARRCAPAPLYAFEPQQRVFQLLCANLALNDVRNAVALPEACGKQSGHVIVPAVDYASAYNFGGLPVIAGETRVPGAKVRVAPIDDLDVASCRLLKIDAEGSEPDILRGGANFIGRHRPVIYVENDRQAQQQDIISLIHAMGYRQYWHTPRLFNPDNLNGVSENVFGTIASLNMLCFPAEAQGEVAGEAPIDPENWVSPVTFA